MTILEVSLDNIPNTWFTLLGMVLMVVINFLFSGDKSFIRALFKSKERKAEEKEKRDDDQIVQLRNEVKTLRNELHDARNELTSARREMGELRTTLATTKGVIDGYEKTMNFIKAYLQKEHPTDEFAQNILNILNK